MRKFDSNKKGRMERPSLMPAREGERPGEAAPSSSPPPRTSWVPPAGGIVKARLLPDVGWEEYNTSNQIQMPPEPAVPSFFNAPSTRESMIPKAPPVPRMSTSTHQQPPPRTSMNPGMGEPPRTSLAPPSRNTLAPTGSPSRESRAITRNDPWERMSLTPALGVPSMAPGPRFDASASEEDRRYTQALFMREQGHTLEALEMLDELCRVAPEHADARSLLLKLALEHKHLDKIEQNAEWVILYNAQRHQHQTVSTLYRAARTSLPQKMWSEKALLGVLMAADKASEGRVVVDVTKMLLHGYPQSPALPRALYASAAVQHNEGRPDLARSTLQNLVNRFPRDSLTPIARRRLNEIG